MNTEIKDNITLETKTRISKDKAANKDIKHLAISLTGDEAVVSQKIAWSANLEFYFYSSQEQQNVYRSQTYSAESYQLTLLLKPSRHILLPKI